GWEFESPGRHLCEERLLLAFFYRRECKSQFGTDTYLIMPRLRVLILARIPLIREGLRGLLAEERDLQVSLLAPSVELLDDLLADEPDVLLLDVDVLEKEGWDLLDELRRALPTLAILIISDNAQDRRMPHAIALGARGYLLRESSAEEMANAIRAAHSGTLVLHPQIAETLLDSMRRAGGLGAGEDAAQDLIEPLSERELDVLRLMTRGM